MTIDAFDGWLITDSSTDEPSVARHPNRGGQRLYQLYLDGPPQPGAHRYRVTLERIKGAEDLPPVKITGIVKNFIGWTACAQTVEAFPIRTYAWGFGPKAAKREALAKARSASRKAL